MPPDLHLARQVGRKIYIIGGCVQERGAEQQWSRSLRLPKWWEEPPAEGVQVQKGQLNRLDGAGLDEDCRLHCFVAQDCNDLQAAFLKTKNNRVRSDL